MNFSQFHSEPFYLKVSKGKVNGHSYIHKFGAVPAMSQSTTGTIWDVNDTLYPWSSFNVASNLTIPAVNASDDGKTIIIQGLDANYNFKSQQVVLSSSGAVQTTAFIRVFRAYITDSTGNVGNIDINVSTTTVARITAGKGQTLMSVYTIPAGFTGYLVSTNATCEAGADASVDTFTRYSGENAFRVAHSFELTGNGGPYNTEFTIPLKLTEKTDIDMRATTRSNNARITSTFDILLSDNSYIHMEK